MADGLAGVVLAAGGGTRLRPLTRLVPKALCPIGNVPLLDRALTRLAAVPGAAPGSLAGPDRVAVNAFGGVCPPGRRHFWAGSFEIGDEFGGLGPAPGPAQPFTPRPMKPGPSEAPGSPIICTGTWCPAGGATPTSYPS